MISVSHFERYLNRNGSDFEIYKKGEAFNDEGGFGNGFTKDSTVKGRLDISPSERENQLGDKDSVILTHLFITKSDADIEKGDKLKTADDDIDREFRVHFVGGLGPNDHHLECDVEEVVHA